MFVTKFLRLLESPMSASGATTTTSSAAAAMSPWNILCSMSSLYYYTRLYGAQLLLLSLLSTVAVYRREMSCNRVYTKDTGNERGRRHRRRSSRSQDNVVADQDWQESAEVLLEGAGAYCSGEPLYPVILHLWAIIFWWESLTTDESNTTCLSSHPSHSIPANDFITRHLPADVQVHFLSYLHPKDVVTFACCSRSARSIVDQGETTSKALWTALWNRDYAWTVQYWKPGMQAFGRSQEAQSAAALDPHYQQQQVMDKEFYFLFGLSFVNYVLAGQNTLKQCYVGLYGHVYDITSFVHKHPGSPETLLVQSGRDATAFFQDMNHSATARRLAQSLCVIVNTSSLLSSFNDDEESLDCGLRPTSSCLRMMPGNIRDEQHGSVRLPHAVEAPPTGRRTSSVNEVLPQQVATKRRGQTRLRHYGGTLQDMATRYFQQEAQMIQSYGRHHHDASSASSSLQHPEVLSHVNVYYDPFLRQWKGWYTSTQFETIFID